MKQKVMRSLMVSCLKATELIEKKSLMPLSWTEKIKLKLHLSLCDLCVHYQHQSKVIDEWLQADETDTDNSTSDNTSLKERILKVLPLRE
ncbi:MAG: hypothetical protein GTN67_10835 [Hydrotalea flava]|uniref:hypothetical protein n=1 Tax=Hydrotalea flava TaxID=714549 RepID=UPI000833585D|nr:hypothetical protein [Hydrotalea flava]RTL48534.1 MAG: hypothetical protein EKK39_12250 [Sphingobacteriales bacterium]NIM35837.1 hypothetical protein [Hydrotalea flava]NIM38689.1 hypothetical protein [Hydrotalea flava]NIN03877.1 hypothetical protein [Hydrotalea flava]NIN15598.1 hypothetical protein [Hydrotalea flava]